MTKTDKSTYDHVFMIQILSSILHNHLKKTIRLKFMRNCLNGLKLIHLLDHILPIGLYYSSKMGKKNCILLWKAKEVFSKTCCAFWKKQKSIAVMNISKFWEKIPNILFLIIIKLLSIKHFKKIP